MRLGRAGQCGRRRDALGAWPFGPGAPLADGGARLVAFARERAGVGAQTRWRGVQLERRRATWRSDGAPDELSYARSATGGTQHAEEYAILDEICAFSLSPYANEQPTCASTVLACANAGLTYASTDDSNATSDVSCAIQARTYASVDSRAAASDVSCASIDASYASTDGSASADTRPACNPVPMPHV